MTGNGLAEATPELAGEIREYISSAVAAAGCKGAVVGISGGLDSAAVTKLCADALGPKRVLNVFMPTSVTPADDYRLTKELSRMWGTEYKITDIQPAVDAFTGMLFSKVPAPLEKGNISARCRMVVLYNRAKKANYLVAGTSNRSELMTGYFTKHGDGASDLAPIAGLYKTQVRQLAAHIGVPREVIDKVPTAGLWEGQTDEGEMGITYRELDLILDGLDRSMGDGEISARSGAPEAKVAEFRARVAKMEHKRVLPPAPPCPRG
ncbi:MAG: NAD+ synthase [Candidatus Methanoplasma sp.]|jgi:NAD+ synthase|nr:NAD+ synthase [Candidatus Methanoplasma sp.]